MGSPNRPREGGLIGQFIQFINAPQRTEIPLWLDYTHNRAVLISSHLPIAGFNRPNSRETGPEESNKRVVLERDPNELITLEFHVKNTLLEIN